MTVPQPVTRQTNLIYARHPKLGLERSSLWLGPYDESEADLQTRYGDTEYGITQSMIAKFYACRERFRLYYCEGLREYEPWSKMRAMEWGNIWHEAEHASLEGRPPFAAIVNYGDYLIDKYGRQFINKIAHDVQIAQLMFKYYLDYYSKHHTETNITPHWAECEFEVGIDLSDNGIYDQPIMRGKMDGVGTLTVKARTMNTGIYTYLMENKTKERIDPALIKDNLEFDNQVMIYLNALRELRPVYDLPPIGGVVYNVIRRPRANQQLDTLERKLQAEPEHYFIRVMRNIDDEQLIKFRNETLLPTLYQICGWWNWIKQDPLNPFRKDERGIPGGGWHWRQPFNVYNNIASGRGDFFGLLTNGSSTQLNYAETLYPELPQ